MVKVALKISFIYFLISLIWITLSDRVATNLYESALVSKDTFYMIQSFKGYFFVGISSLLMFFLIQVQTKNVEQVKNDFIRLFDENPNPMWIYDLDNYNILHVNNAAVATYLYSIEEFKKLTIFDLRPSSEHEKLKKNLEESKKSNQNYNTSHTWLHKKKNGQSFYVNVYSHKTIYEQTTCRIVTAIDIDFAFRAELDLLNINRALKSSTHLCITDLDGIILEVNEIFAVTCGYSVKELLGNSTSIVSSNYHSAEHWNNFWKTLKSGQVWRGEVCNKKKDGSIYWYGTVVTPILNQFGTIYKYMSISRDITQKKQLEASKHKTTEQLKEYAYITSHDIRGPLTRLLALTDFYELSDENEIDFVLTNIKKTSLELDEIIRQMNDKVENDLAI